MNFVKVISSGYDDFTRRIVKFLRLGKSDTQTSFEASSYGVDGNPIKDMVAIYSATGERGKTVILGYINKNQKAATGEVRLFCTDDNGLEQFSLWLKKNGTIEIGGNSNNMVRYTALNNGLNNQKIAINTELVKVQAAIASLGGAYAHSPVAIDISASKIDEIKTL